MSILKKIRNKILNTFREIFIHHHTSLEFRAKLIAAVIAANETDDEHKCEIELLNNISSHTYSESERIDLLILTTMEYVTQVRENNGLDLDALILDILKDLKHVPRYYKKIDIDSLEVLTKCHYDEDTKDYQKSIIELFRNTKKEYEEKYSQK